MNEPLRLGELIHDGDRTGLHFVRHLRHEPDRVWRALTESDQLRQWMPVDIVGPRRAGAAITLPFWPDVAAKYEIAESVLPGEILEWDPPRRFSWRWDTDTLIFELHPTEAGTRLEFTAWTAGGPPVHQVAAGYQVCFDQLIRLLDDGVAPPFIDQSPHDYEVLYAQAFDMQP